MEPLRPGGLLDGRYRLDRRIGAGGMSVVWRAVDEALDRPVAVKVLAGPAAADPGFRARVQAEARSAARLVHPNVVTVYDYAEVSVPVRRTGDDGGGDDGDDGDDGPVLMSVTVLPFVVLELVDGASLEHRLAAGPLPWPAAVRVTAQVAAALAAAHDRGIVHRDVTAGNVLLTSDGAKVIDFGISAMTGSPDPEPVSNALLGTPGYLAPERLDGSAVAPAADIYSLGVLLDAMLTGRLPDEHHPADPSVPPAVPGLPPEVEELRKRCLATDPASRPAASEIAERLSTVDIEDEPEAVAGHQEPEPVPASGPRTTLPLTTRRLPDRMPARHRRLAVVAVAAVVVLGLAGALIAALSGRHGPVGYAAPRSPSGSATVSPLGPVSPSGAPSGTPSGTASALPVAPGQCRVNWVVNTDWGSGFGVQLLVSGGRPLNGWTLTFVFPGDQRVEQGWNGQFTQHGDTVTVRNASYNGNVADGQLDLGFNGSYTRTNQRPTTFTLNGTPCSVG